MADTDTSVFGAWDWVLFGAMLLVSSIIGLYYAVQEVRHKRENRTGEFLMGGRNLPVLPVAISLFVSFISAISILGIPAEMYTAGTLYYLWFMAGMISAGALIFTTVLFVPLLYPLNFTSSFEYLECSFKSKAAKLTGTLIMIVQQVLYMGIASYAPSTALEAVTGFPTWATIVTVGCVSTLYTFLGGMKAVVWTDVFQSLVMLAGLLAIVIQGTIKVGGLSEVWKINDQWERIDFWEADPDPTVRHSVWTLVVGGTVGWLGVYGVNQASVQRYCAVRTLNASRGAVLLNIVGVIVIVTITSLAGIVMFAFYAQKGCDPLTSSQVSNANQLMPFFVMEVLSYPGLPGLFVSCLFSGALSTMSSSLSALSAVTWQDIVKPLIGDTVSESTKTWITRFLVIFYGAAGVGFAFTAQNLGGTVLQASLSFTGAAAGPSLGIFLLGALFPWANWIGCVAGGVLGLALPMWISIGAYSLPRSGYGLDFPTNNCTTEIVNATLTTTAATLAIIPELSAVEKLYTVSYLWYPSIGAATAVIVGLVLSFITGPMSVDEIDPKYLIPIFDRLFCCLRESIRRKLRCGLHFQDPEDITRNEKDKEISVDQIGKETSIGSTKLGQREEAEKDPIDKLSHRQTNNPAFVYDNKGGRYRDSNAYFIRK